MTEQTEKAFLKQPKVFLCPKGNKPGKGETGSGRALALVSTFKTPREAIEGTYIDKKCSVSGTVSIRGRIIAGTCEKRHSNIPAHISPCFRANEGDHVIIGQCRPPSKTVRFKVLKVIPAGSKSGAVKKAFTAA
nr:unnamed protein product [Digitaria exilis]